MLENKKLWSCKPSDPGGLLSDVQVWAAWLNVGSEEMTGFWSTLSNQERERAGRFAFERDRGYFVAARGLLRLVLGSCLGTEPCKVEFRHGDQGKPAVGGAFARSGLQFNLAHSGNLAVFAVAHHRTVGVDVEQVRPVSQLSELIEGFFSAGERAELEALSAEKKATGFFRIWTRKEAWLKATGKGITGSLKCIDVLGPPAQEEPDWRPTPGSPGTRFCLRDLLPAPGFLGALAVAVP